MEIVQWLDYAGVAVFAATGALAASRKQLDFIAFIFLAAVTGIGGGTFRDAILGQTPVFWVREHAYLLICAGTGALVFFTAHRFESRYKVLLWLDAIGMAVFSVKGAEIGFLATGSSSIAVVTGILTATFGGVLRDIISGEQSVLMRREIYVTAALFGSVAWVLSYHAGLENVVGSILGFLVAFVVRGGALYYGWNLPTYKSKPGRTMEEIEKL
ncbi:membrane protein [Kiloniella litopenaei]|uniref:Membrane protein n=1 Tax=Kiloniella litopenaei TaxID=1549748 RepID=A0A0M2R8G4_9PROT|nr:trimeric intracellular cation channel family protein [Kiloniella litopenaei]KKJ78162.1 membrane protein [Kiloniella litopenaei]